MVEGEPLACGNATDFLEVAHRQPWPAVSLGLQRVPLHGAVVMVQSPSDSICTNAGVVNGTVPE